MAITGFVTTKRGKYYAVLNLYDEMGTRKQKWFPTDLPIRGNKRNAERILRDLIEEWESRGTRIVCTSLMWRITSCHTSNGTVSCCKT